MELGEECRGPGLVEPAGARVPDDGAAQVDVSIAEAEAERVARLAAADQVVLVQLPGEPR